jgi:hypothetical protein
MPPRQMVRPYIAETSGVDRPAHLVSGWLTMKALDDNLTPEMACLMAKAEAISMGVELPADFEEVFKRDFTQAQRDAAEKKGHAMEGGGYPINTTADLHNAIKAFGRAKNPEATKRHIIEQARRLGATGSLPDDWQVSKGVTMPTEEMLKSLDPDVQAYIGDLTSRLTKAASKPHSYSPSGDDGDSDTDCDTCGMAQDEGNHFSKAADPVTPPPTDADIQRQVFEKALNELPEPLRKAWADQQRQIAEAQAVAKALTDERETNRFTAMAKSLAHVPTKGYSVETLVPVLRKASESSPAEFEVLFDILKAADAALGETGAFGEIGTETSGSVGSAADTLDGLAKAFMKDDANLSYPEALSKAAEQNPDLYNQHRAATIRRQNGVED